MVSQHEVVLRMTPEQAKAVEYACDVLARVGMGQLEILAEMVAQGFIPVDASTPEPRFADSMTSELARLGFMDAKRALGFPQNGNRGIGHRHNRVGVHRAYEVGTVLAKALAEHERPNPTLRNHRYDGLRVRYTQDPAPTAEVVSVNDDVPSGGVVTRKVYDLIGEKHSPEGGAA